MTKILGIAAGARGVECHDHLVQKDIPSSGETPFSLFRQNLVKPPRRRFLDYVVDSLGEVVWANMSHLPYAL
jgi:hypothetical protein